MLQDTSNPVLPHVQSSPQRASVQVDVYANRLMDDLFDEVEKLLDGSILPPEPVKKAPAKKLEVAAPQFSNLVPRPSLPQWKPQGHELASSTMSTTRNADQTKPSIAAKPALRMAQSLQKGFVLTLCASAVAVGALWLTSRGFWERFGAALTQQPQASATAPIAQTPDTNVRFSQYLQRSLAAIDRRAATGQLGTTAPFNNALPMAPIPVNVARSNTPLPKAPIAVNVSPMPSPAASPDSGRELNQILSRLSSILESFNGNRAAGRPAQTPVINSSETVRSLSGIAIATDPTRSAVLFEMNGVTQRYYIGESIGSSGWSVVDISSNYVTVRRNGEVRSISIGQKL